VTIKAKKSHTSVVNSWLSVQLSSMKYSVLQTELHRINENSRFSFKKSPADINSCVRYEATIYFLRRIFKE